MTETGLASIAPPHDEEAEASVLGAVMLADRWFDPLVSECGLVPADFYRPRNQTIFTAMLELAEAGEPMDTLTVATRLAETGKLDTAGGKDYIETLVTRIPAIGNTKQYGDIVKENAWLRQLVAGSQRVQEMVAARTGDPQELIDAAREIFGAVGGDTPSGGLVDLSETLLDALSEIDAAKDRAGVLTGVTSGLRDLDAITHGFQPGTLVVIGARPSMGKSALASTIADAAAGEGHPVAVFTMEMDRQEYSERLLAARSHLPGGDIKTGDLDGRAWSRLMRAGQELSEMPISIDDGTGLTVAGIRAAVRRKSGKREAKKLRPIELVIVDYLQELRVDDIRAPRTYQVEEQVRALKRMARDLNVPVILLAQLSREVERRKPPIPQLADLKDSGAIEQAADIVILLYREEYYKKHPDRPGEADLIVAKHRGGEKGTVEVGFVAHYPAFVDLIVEQTGSPENAASQPAFVAGRDDPGEPQEELPEPVF